MDAELDHLQQQLEELIRYFDAQKQENRELKSRIATLQTENKRLAAKVDAAVRGVSAVLETLPES
ncbi:hypothetical protein [Denitromonas ohlonensis]|jgi:uncharacterized protein (TIGR02449 family)|uniref:Cell division protein ZapB n=2 Tax=Denitromonas TaxID=139331 RepID=A0A558E774_9RHOO|nr:hypothetical protein [Denitromonas ohlonensis]TVT50818.1 MAG: hypothetical protein FHP94_00465 [Denitromonas halophila]TVO67081.1 hypothetical protein FHP90_07935 [Denitromonas ohlonensis]TVO79141.1 hypothetical protein FHP89_02855 [Denitromonas ohlonensis]TVT69241.1 MAG: hypothetical protein FHP93_13690 [Denitromonas halophila]TVT76186.1 MAG: hypothetical protein FHP92_09175 [Denitromonas halophila]